MIRIIRADIYRVLRDKALYIALAIVLSMVTLFTFVFQSVPEIFSIFILTFDDDAMVTNFADGATAAQMALSLIPALFVIFLPLFRAVTIGYQQGILKNEISAGFSRTQLYLSKWILSSILSMIYALIFFTLTVLFATLLSDFGDWSNGFLVSILQSLGVMMLFVVAFTSVGVFLSFLFKTAYVVVEVYLFALLVPLLLAAILGLSGSPIGDAIIFFCLSTQATRFANISGMAQADIITGLAVCLAFIVIPTVVGIFRFRKVEIK